MCAQIARSLTQYIKCSDRTLGPSERNYARPLTKRQLEDSLSVCVAHREIIDPCKLHQ